MTNVLKLQRKLKHTFYGQKRFSKSCRYEITSKNMVEPERPQMTVWRMLVVCWMSKAIRACTHTYTQTNTEICNSYCFLKAAMASEMRLKIRFKVFKITIKVMHLVGIKVNNLYVIHTLPVFFQILPYATLGWHISKKVRICSGAAAFR